MSAPVDLAAKLAGVLTEARRSVEHTPDCLARWSALLLLTGCAPSGYCHCDYGRLVEAATIRAVVREVERLHGPDMVRAYYAQPALLEQVALLEARLAAVHARALV